MQPLIDALISVTPVVAAALATLVVSYFRDSVSQWIRPKFYPVLLPIAGGVVASVAQLVGVDIGDLNAATADFNAWQTAIAGVMTGGFMVGLHQIPKQLKKPE